MYNSGDTDISIIIWACVKGSEIGFTAIVAIEWMVNRDRISK